MTAITFAPLDNFEGNTTFTYTVSDGYNSSTSLVHVTISPQKDGIIRQPTPTSNSDTIIELDQSAYSWTDKVHITITAPNHNLNHNMIDEIGNYLHNPIKVSTIDHTLDQYKLVETGVDTGVFTGHVTLTGFKHDADGYLITGDSNGFDTNPRTGNFNGQNSVGLGPTNGYLETSYNDLITVSFELSEDEVVIGYVPIQWSVGTVEWLEDISTNHGDGAAGTNTLRITDPDMNLNPDYPDDFDVAVWSDTDSGGIDLTVRETGNATGIFEGTLYYLFYNEGSRLATYAGDTVTAEYTDYTLPYHQSSLIKLDIIDTMVIGN